MSTTQGMNSSSYTCDGVEGSAQHQIDLVSAELHKNKKTNEGEAGKCVANKWRRPWLQFGASNFASPVQKRGSQFHLLAARLEDDEDRVKMEALQTPSPKTFRRQEEYPNGISYETFGLTSKICDTF